MFRTVILRTSASAVRAAVARPAAIRRTALMAAPRAVAAPVRVQSLMGVRMYSAGGSLNKEEVEGRILSLLQGFDKVGRCFAAARDFSAMYGGRSLGHGKEDEKKLGCEAAKLHLMEE